MYFRGTTVLVLSSVVGLGCSTTSPGAPEEADAALANANTNSVTNHAMNGVTARDVAARTTALLGARLGSTSSSPTGSLRFEPSPGARAPQRITLPHHPDFWIEIVAEDLSSVPATHAGGHAVFLEAAPETDVVHLATSDWFEEVRWLRSSAASPTIRERLHLGPGVASARLREGHLELLSASGRVELATAPLWALDARGVFRTLRVELERGEPGKDPTLVATLDTSGLTYPVAIDPLWSTAAALTTPRTGGTAVTAIGGGKAIAVGGSNAGGALTDVEIYDLATNTWSTVTPLKLARSSASITYLSGSKKVVACQGSSTATTSVEVYDVATNAWSDGTPFDVYRPYYGIAPTAGGTRVLLVDSTTKSEVYDPATKVWTVTSAMPFSHQMAFAMTPLPDGRVLVTGGGQIPPGAGGSNSKASLFTSSGLGGTWASAPDMHDVRLGHGAAVIGGTKVFVGGGSHVQGVPSGYTIIAQNSTDIYDIASNTWTASSPVSKAGPLYVAGLGNGRGYLFETAYLEIYTPGTALFAAGGATTSGLTGVTLDGSDILFLSSAGDANELFRLYGLGATCAAGSDCTSGSCVLGACCSTASCAAGYACNGPTKPGICGKALGAACGGAGECDSGVCVDGVCCNSACGGQCQACDVLGKAGTCSPVAGPPHGARAACSAGADVCLGQSCNGTDTAACHFAGGGTPCGAASCKDGIETHVSSCDGTGKCGDVAKPCGSYSCGPSACRTTCGTPPDCMPGYYCDLTKATCNPLTGLGTSCDAATPCGTGLFCTDGHCCGKSSCGTGSSCGIPTHEGQCFVKNGFACTTDLQCGSAHCIDGICCDGVCGGQCEACDVKGAEGTCTVVKGKAHGARPACGVGTDTCNAPLCDGSARDRCAGFTTVDTECRAASCKDGVVSARGTCDGKGACPTAITSSCDGYACDVSASACLTTCSGDSDCTTGYHCSASKCTKKATACNEASDGVVQVDGTIKPCSPFRCRAGACIDACSSSDECQPGLVCSADTKSCVSPPTSDSGGCSVDGVVSGSSSGGSLAVLALLGALASLGHRARRRPR